MADAVENEDDHDCGVIRPIETESVQRIVAGQAVTDLASAVKELLDNALDAGSTSINIRLFNQGLDILEVSDDGSGVPPESRPFLAQAHATSKIRSFDDIYSTANSLGFRGEALFCLANLSEKLIVATRTEDESVGQKMEFKHDGSMNTDTIVPTPRKIGTTVAVVKLLRSLPVRRADLERRITQHRTKMMRMMEGYAIFNVGVRINLMDVVKGKESALLATSSNSRKLEQNISSVLGSKFLSSVSPLLVDLKNAVDKESPKGDWKLEGFLSKAPSDKSNNGAKTGQHFFSINGRPVELPKIARTIGDVWRTFGGKKKFSCILTLTLPNQEYDVNLSPEKREVLLTNEESIVQAVHVAVAELWASQTEGLFVPNASQPAAAAPAPATPAVCNLKRPLPKINNMESLAKIQESNRKRAREMHAQIPSLSPIRTGGHVLHDDRGYGEMDFAEGESDQPAGRRAYIRRFKEEQHEQRKLNESQEGASCQYGEETTAVHEKQPPTPGESQRLQRRGGFVHDISTAKQFARPSSIDKNIEIPPGIEHLDAGKDSGEKEAREPAKGQLSETPRGSRTPPIRTTDNLSMIEAAALAASDFAIEDESEQCSSRRVTLSLNNEPSNNTSYIGPSNHKDACSIDTDKNLWMGTQSRFNQRSPTSPENEIDVLVKSSVSPKMAAFETPSHLSNQTSSNTNKTQALNLEQFAFREVDSVKNSGKLGPTAAKKKNPAVSPEEFAMLPQRDVTRGHVSMPPSIATGSAKHFKWLREAPQSASTKDTDATKPGKCDIVWGRFSGTRGIVSMAKSKQQQVQERKQKLRKARPEAHSDKEETGERLSLSKHKYQNQKVTLSKQDFASMTIVGQFNLGFIVAMSDAASDLWILDQHACDERHNFERLMKETVMHNQKLIVPMPLELDPWEESCILDNLELFQKNGFQFAHAEDKPPRHRLSLTALPHSGAQNGRKAVTYGPEDVSALCVILGAGGQHWDDNDHVTGGTGVDGTGVHGNNAVRRYAGSQANSKNADKVITRLPKAIAMFASRACRGSIMIGTALSKSEMRKVLNTMEGLSDPWNCAHGRPTTTHINNLHSALLTDECKLTNRISGPTATMSLSKTQEPSDGNT